MFYDQAKVYVKSGDGGDGMISFRREKYVSLGGPDGADGGDGGNIIIKVNPNLNSLVSFHRNVHYRAEDGVHGGRRNMTGARGQDLCLEVPPGTTIRDADTGDILADLTRDDQEVLLISGGRGGRGNARFANSVNQAPRIAERGEPGEERWLHFELKLIADVGIVGVPNAGKSTLLSVISAAKPKIANYPFTTLQPNLGVVQLDDYNTMVIADIPGLIEGAAAGIGLGHDFLRHVERTRVLIHLLDGSSQDPLEEWAMINQELALYDIDLARKPQLVVLNKVDLVDGQAWEPLIEEEINKHGYPFFSISAVTQQNVRDMLWRVKQMLDDAPEPTSTVEPVVITPSEDDDSFTIERENDGWRIRGRRIERVATMTYWEFEATARRFQNILEKMGITTALEKAGIEEGDTVYINDIALVWGDETYADEL
ncbi:MAG TPA: GTPase ObgE [Anaerolineae bacterium]|nr:GTPase ObgE [Anaerolineae bacterium]